MLANYLIFNQLSAFLSIKYSWASVSANPNDRTSKRAFQSLQSSILTILTSFWHSLVPLDRCEKSFTRFKMHLLKINSKPCSFCCWRHWVSIFRLNLWTRIINWTWPSFYKTLMSKWIKSTPVPSAFTRAFTL